MASVTINGIDITVEDGTLILDAARQAGFHIPTFCYQADLIGIGSCRMCIVEIEGQKKLHPSCITPVMDGMRILTETDLVNQARSDMLEFLLANHGLDCPVCDKGGECELQDMVYDYGPHKGRYAETKYQWHEKDYTLSPVIIKNSNRCVQCMKCVRVCKEIVGQNVLDGLHRGERQEETTFFRSPLDCDQDGNCIEVCPVGCFMRVPFRYKTRPWDLTGADTICPYCGTGCRMVVEERDGDVIRSRAQLGVGINSETLCARGRFGYDFIHHPDRLTTPMLRTNGQLQPATWDETLGVIEQRFQAADPIKTAGIASARLTNEELYLFQKLFRTVLKSPNIDSGTRWDPEAVKQFIFTTGMTRGGVSIFDCMAADQVLIVGTHISDENPVTDYMVRRMARENDTGVSIASPRAMKLDSSARQTLRHLPGTERELLTALSKSIVKKYRSRLKNQPALAAMESEDIRPLSDAAGIARDDLERLARTLTDSDTIGLIIGMAFLRFPRGVEALSILVDVLTSLEKAVSIVPILDRCNQRGAWEMGVLPGWLPGYRPDVQPALGYVDMMDQASRGGLDLLYLIGEDPVATHPDPPALKETLKRIPFLMVQDVFLSDTAQMADCVLPGACFAEKEGTFTNQEGRVQSIARLMKPPGSAKSDLVIIGDIGRQMAPGFAPKTRRFMPVFEEIRKTAGMYAGVSLDFVNHRNEDNDLDNRQALTQNAGLQMEITFGPPGPAPDSRGAGDAPDEFTLITGDHLFHSGRLSRKSEILNSLLAEPVVEISSEDAEKLNLHNGQTVRVTNARHETVLRLKTVNGSKTGVAFIAENFEAVSINRFFKPHRFAARVSIAAA